MYISNCLSTNENGHLSIGGADTVKLAEKYGTPLYVMDENTIRSNCRDFKNSIDKYYSSNGMVTYASKAFCCKEIYRIMKEEGLGADVVSGGELYTALSVGFPMDRVIFHGNNKTPSELTMAIENGVSRIVVDNIFELELIDSISKSLGKKANVMFRIKPGIDAHTHEFIMTGQIDSKFGFALETGEALTAVGKTVGLDNINYIGIHCHIGSQIFDVAPFELAAEKMVTFAAEIRKEFGIDTKEINLGGGFGIKYLPEHDPRDYDNYMERVSKVIKATCANLDMAVPFVIIEPGRSIVGPAGITLYTVGAVKTIPDVRTYVSIDGGMGDNPRYALYKSDYDILLANAPEKPKDFVVTVAGKCCESGDLIQENAAVQKLEVGNILAVLATGAYNYSMSSNYNRIPRPATVFIKDGEDRVVINRESYEDLVKNDM